MSKEPYKLEKNRVKKPYIVDGHEIPGVTTIINSLAKPALIKWAYQMGRKGQSIDNQSATDIGTLAHYMCECYARGWEGDIDDAFSRDEIKTASKIFNKFVEYWGESGASLVDSEVQLIDPEGRFGGTLDLLVETKRGPELWDLKTSKFVYPTFYIQVEAYSALAYHYIGKFEPRIILIPKQGKMSMEDIDSGTRGHAKEAWIGLVQMYPHWKWLENVKGLKYDKH